MSDLSSGGSVTPRKAMDDVQEGQVSGMQQDVASPTGVSVRGLRTLFQEKIQVINLGLPSFAEDLKKQGVPVQMVDWKPPAGGNKKIQLLLEKVKKSQEKLHD